MGLKSLHRVRQKKRRLTCYKEVETFWLRDDVSRTTAGKKECRSVSKEKQQIRYTVDTLQNLYKKYKEEGGRLGMTTLWKYKPFYVLSPQLNSRNTCLCIKHANIELQFKALKIHGLLNKDLIKIFCQCKNRQVNYSSNDDENKNISWWQWERVDHEYIKNNKTVKTKKTVKSFKNTSIATLKHAFNEEIIAFKKHIFIMRHQQEQYQKIINNLNENEAVIICDYSENYDCKMRDEVQALHYGASKHLVALHTGAIFWQANMQSFCTISENNGHRPENIWAHLTPILDEIRMKTPDVKIIHFYSDGPTSQGRNTKPRCVALRCRTAKIGGVARSYTRRATPILALRQRNAVMCVGRQYRQKGNFCLLSVLPKEMGFEYCTWSFSESGHGKSIADGIGGSVKRTLDKHVSFGADATNATQIYNILSECMKSVKIFLIDDIKVDEYTIKLPNNLRTLIGTLKLHQVITLKHDATKINFRDLSCFCGDDKGMCFCFSPQTHALYTQLEEITPSHNSLEILKSTSDPFLSCNIIPNECVPEVQMK
ncbi:hypothetical protein ABMA28_003124 [Loxostege sticticalis]|uniref:Uncharacterized protein n=1 Tax=Loxostege sticticalis TaxID=481309 RepID=A0ABD0SV46_LOXSC